MNLCIKSNLKSKTLMKIMPQSIKSNQAKYSVVYTEKKCAQRPFSRKPIADDSIMRRNKTYTQNEEVQDNDKPLNSQNENNLNIQIELKSQRTLVLHIIKRLVKNLRRLPQTQEKNINLFEIIGKKNIRVDKNLKDIGKQYHSFQNEYKKDWTFIKKSRKQAKCINQKEKKQLQKKRQSLIKRKEAANEKLIIIKQRANQLNRNHRIVNPIHGEFYGSTNS